MAIHKLEGVRGCGDLFWTARFKTSQIRSLMLHVRRFTWKMEIFTDRRIFSETLGRNSRRVGLSHCQQRYTSRPAAPKAHINDSSLNFSHADACWCPNIEIEGIWENFASLAHLKILVCRRRSHSFKSLVFYCIIDNHGTFVKCSCVKLEITSFPWRC